MELPPPPAGKRRPEGADLSRAAWRSVARLGHQAPRGSWGWLCCCVEGRRGPEEPGSPPALGSRAHYSSGSNESPWCPVPNVGPEDLVLLVFGSPWLAGPASTNGPAWPGVLALGAWGVVWRRPGHLIYGSSPFVPGTLGTSAWLDPRCSVAGAGCAPACRGTWAHCGIFWGLPLKRVGYLAPG